MTIVVVRRSFRVVGNLARQLAAVPFRRRWDKLISTPVLLPGYLESAEQCARANNCRWCLHALAAVAPSTCNACGREPFRRRCRDCGPCR